MVRIDVYLKDNSFFESREKAKKAILDGLVKINGDIIRQPSKKIFPGSIQNVEIDPKAYEYVSRGAYKLLAALEKFNINVENLIAVDVGASTGGFSDVLLQRNIKKIYCIDVGKGQLHAKIKNSAKVISYEKTDIREVDSSLICDADLIVMDVSFISTKLIIPKINSIFTEKDVIIISLLKPQFECGMEIAKKFCGIINDPVIHENVIRDVALCWKENGFVVSKIINSPIKGGDGNIEYLIYVQRKGYSIDDTLIKDIVRRAFDGGGNDFLSKNIKTD